MTDKIYYNSAKDLSKPLTLDLELPTDYITKYTEYAEKIMDVSNSIITYDLIRKVGENPDNELLEETSIGDEK